MNVTVNDQAVRVDEGTTVAAEFRVTRQATETLDAPADAAPRLEHRDRGALARQQPRGVQAREARADDDDVAAFRHARHG